MILLICAVSDAMADELSARAYARVVAEKTEELRIYDGWYTALLVRGTLVDDDLRVAQDARLAAITGNAAATEGPPTLDVVLTASTQFPKELAFSADGSKPWTVHLKAGEHDCLPPLSITETRKPSPTEFALFPQLTQWDRLFRLSFSADACGGADATELALYSARGHGSVRWKR